MIGEDDFLALCDPHTSIIHEYGCDNSCNKTATICLKGCSEYEHKQKVNRHEFISARQFYTTVAQLRQHYKQFQVNFKEVYMKRFLKDLREAIESFQQNFMAKFGSEKPLAEIYSRSNGEVFQSVLEDKEEDIEFSEFKCKQIYQIRQLSQNIYKDVNNEQEKRVFRILTKFFDDHLRQLKLLPPLKTGVIDNKNKRQEIIQADKLDKISQAIETRIGEIQKGDRVDEIIIKIKDELHTYKQSNENEVRFNKYFEVQQALMEKLRPTQLTLAVRGIVTSTPFWLLFFKLIPNHKIREIKIIMSNDSQESKACLANIASMYRQKVEINYLTADWQNNPKVFNQK